MNIKVLLSLSIVLLSAAFIACDDDLNSVGSTIQPGDDEIFVYADSVDITARTVSLNDSVYARTEMPIIGEYTDPVFGTVKTDFLSELYCPEGLTFHPKTLAIDSVNLSIISQSFIGDSISPFGISAYRLNKNLERNYFTNVDPREYYNPADLLGQGLFTIQDGEPYDGARRYKIELDQSIGQTLYDDWRSSEGAIFANNAAFREYFKGIYVTNTFGSGNIQVINTVIFQVHYRFTGRNNNDTSDSIRSGFLRLPLTSEVIQLNRTQNKIPESLFDYDGTKTYTKTPAGVCTEFTIPLSQIVQIAKETGIGNNKINSANFRIRGYTEEESTETTRPSYLLFINKDSVQDFFSSNKIPDARTSFLMIRNSSTQNNTYQFSSSNTLNVSNNIANMVNHYVDYYKDKDEVPDLKYLAIPVSVRFSGTSSYTVANVYNLMQPTTAIFRTDPDNMRMSFIFSNYN